jgi:hypothetical protein
MKQRRGVSLVLMTLAGIYLSFREATTRGTILSSVAIGVLLTGLLLQWAEFFVQRGQNSAARK